MLTTHARGYSLQVEPQAVDLQRFEALVAQARAAEPERASMLLHAALALWRGSRADLHLRPSYSGWGADSSDLLAPARAFSNVQARVNNRALIPRPLRAISCVTNPAACRHFVMGREGFEPSTLGLRVPCSTS
jgi:hypothetical protein